jgi:predicted  nucleic acid-binding Zn-ribbon protein
MYGEYNEFKEETMGMGIPERMRLIEKLYAEIDEVKSSREAAVSKVIELEQSREAAVSKVVELEQSREEAVSRVELERQRLRDTVRNILKAGQPVEQVVQWTGLPQETVQALAAQLN